MECCVFSGTSEYRRGNEYEPTHVAQTINLVENVLLGFSQAPGVGALFLAGPNTRTLSAPEGILPSILHSRDYTVANMHHVFISRHIVLTHIRLPYF